MIDYLALSPLLILLVGGLLLLIMECLSELFAKKWGGGAALLTLTLAFFAALYSPSSINPLLSSWVSFDALSRGSNLFILAIGVACNLLSQKLLSDQKVSRTEYDFLLIMATIGLLLIASAADFLILFLGLEILSLALYVLVGYIRTWNLSGEASLKYFLLGAIGAAFLVYGIALIYGATGHTSLNGLLKSYQGLSTPESLSLFFGGVVFITVGLCFKAAIVPFHFWAPDVYEGSPTPITAFMAVGVKVGAFLAFTRVFIVALPHFNVYFSEALAALSMGSLIYANFLALKQVSLRRFFAYSGISHSGFLLIAVVAGSLPALAYYLVVYALATLSAFSILAILDKGERSLELQDLKGLAYRHPFLAFIFGLSLLTLSGMPPTVGFFAKITLFKAALEAGYLTLVIVALLTTTLSFYYYLRIVSSMFGTKEEESPSFSKRMVVFAAMSSLSLGILAFFPEILFHLLNVGVLAKLL